MTARDRYRLAWTIATKLNNLEKESKDSGGEGIDFCFMELDAIIHNDAMEILRDHFKWNIEPYNKRPK